MFDYQPREDEFSAKTTSYPVLSFGALWSYNIWNRYDNILKIKAGPSVLLTPIGSGKSVFGTASEEREYSNTYSTPLAYFGGKLGLEYLPYKWKVGRIEEKGKGVDGKWERLEVEDNRWVVREMEK